MGLRRRALPSLLLIVLASVSTRALAQDIAVGSHVRVFPLGGTQPSEGTLAALSPDSVAVRIGMSSTVRTLAMDSVTAIDVGEGVRARHGVVLRDIAIGAGIGLGAVYVATLAGCADHHSSGDSCVSGAMILVGVPLGVGGALLGAHIGKNDKHEQWQRVLDRSRTTTLLIGPTQNHGFAVGLSIPFGSGAALP